MRPLRLLPLRAAAAAGPAALAFFGGAYFDQPRQVALVVVWVLVAYAAVCCPLPRPPGTPLLVALAALALLCGWVALRLGHTPLKGLARDDLERDLLYLGALIVAAVAWRARSAAGLAEPLLAAGALVVVGYGLSGRLLPGIVDQVRTAAADGRLDQPLGYWNATGALAAVGFVLCVRIAGDLGRSAALRAGAAAAAVPLLAGVYLSFSRGAVAALAAGLIVLFVLAPSWPQLRAIAVCLEMGALACGAAALSPSVRDFGSSSAQGFGVLVAMLVAAGAAAALTWWGWAEEERGAVRAGEIALPRRSGLLAALLVAALVVLPVAAAGSTDGPRSQNVVGATNARFGSVGSNRYDYWKVALKVWGDHPLAGAGPASFGVEWLQRRTIAERVHDAHSLEIESLAELGLVGLALLLALTGAVVVAIRRVRLTDAALAAGPAAALATWGLHASLDWDWEMPALTLVGVSLAGLVLTRAGTGGD